jgi:hypothetical protein|tara:strand:+ start:212 stop:391 length:180 start_codon:yes stop_codon:yes gene_type:complete
VKSSSSKIQYKSEKVEFSRRRKMKSFAKKPQKGGIPAIFNIAKSSTFVYKKFEPIDLVV